MIWLLVGNEKKRTTLYVFHFNQDITVVLVKKWPMLFYCNGQTRKQPPKDTDVFKTQSNII